ncbi:cytosolic phospholipase A2-like [Mytilus trossulus]|uniref:cytosolic phospholipase A2-like n=1 Tax=Mytilus trossulus TaxID=6551 RepID=UPI0030053733
MSNLESFDPFQVFEVSHYPCTILYIKVVRGYNITKGWAADLMDTPDPFVSLYIKTSPNCLQKTKTVDNEVNPVWDETFQFYLDPRDNNELEITLIDANYTIDETIGMCIISLKDLPYATERETKTLQFNKTSEVDIEMWAVLSVTPDLRFSLTLCEEERTFLAQRKRVIFESMKKQLGSDAPKSSREVPTIGVLGSGGGFRAMTAYSGVFSALVDSKILDMTTYVCGLSGSAWYLSQLYSNPEWPKKSPKELQPQLKDNIDSSPFLLLGPRSMYKYVSNIIEKRRQGQPVSFTDFFGHLVGETLLHERMNAKLTDQRDIIETGEVPFPLYTCLHVKRQVSAMIFHEWMEFSAYEIGLPKYGTFMKTEHFGSKYFMGQLVRKHPEPPLHFLQGIWGSAFCIQLKRLLKDDKKVMNECRSSFDEREEMAKELLDDMGNQTDDDSESSESEDDTDDKKQNDKRKNKTIKKENKPDKKDHSFWKSVLGTVFDANSWINSIEGRAAKVHSFMRGLSLYKVYPFSPFTSINEETADQFDGIFELFPTTMKKLYVVDGGLTFNSPYPLLLRPQRQVDLILSFDFSARPTDDTPPFKEIKIAEHWAHKNNVPFPPIDVNIMEKEGIKECYVFEDRKDPKCPTILHFVLSNINFRNETQPDVPRQTDEEKEFGDFQLFDDPKRPYSTFNFNYSHLAFERITQLTEYNTLRFKNLIMDKVRECVRKYQDSTIRRPIKLQDIKKLRLGAKDKEDRLKQFVESFDTPDS